MKKAQAAIITTVLLILLVLAAVVIISSLLLTTTEKSGKEISKTKDCLKNIQLDVTRACYNQTFPGIWELKLLIQNEKNIDFNDSLFLYITWQGNSEKHPPYEQKMIEGLGQKSFTIIIEKDPETAEDFTLIPKLGLEDESINCYQRAVKFKPREC